MINTDQKLSKKDLAAIYKNQFFIRSCLNFEKFQCMGFTTAMQPIIDKYYETPEERQEIIDRHMQLFLTQPMVAAIPIGVAAAMEERIATEGDLEPESVNAVKTALMSPLAALGDSLLNGTLRPIAAGIACSLALQGSIFGPILFLILMAIMTLGVRYFGVYYCYKQGVNAITMLQENGLMERLTEITSVIAYTVIGGFVPSNVGIALGLNYTTSDGSAVISIQQTLDSLIPGLLPVLLTLLCHWLITKKRVNPVILMLSILVLGTLGALVGIF